MRHFVLLALSATLVVTPRPAAGQEPAVRVDTLVSIAAVVGDSIVTMGELRQLLEVWAATEAQPVPEPGTSEYNRVVQTLLEERINGLLLYQAALRDTTLAIPDDQLRSAIDRQIEQIIAQSFEGNRAAFEQAIRENNLTVQEFRDLRTAQLRHQQMTARYIQKVAAERKPPPISDSEIRQFFEDQAGDGQLIPPSVSFEQIVVHVQPSDSALAAARARADSIMGVLRGGAEFGPIARRLSHDTATAILDGTVGYFRMGNMTRAFELAAFSMVRPGELAGPVRTPFGLHIIRLDRIRGPERQASHILIRPPMTEADNERARDRVGQMVEELKAGASMDSLRRVYGDPEEAERVGPLPRDSLPEGYREALGAAEPGTVAGPFFILQNGVIPAFAIVRLTRVEDARQATVDDYRKVIIDRLGEIKLRQELLSELRRSTYVDVRVGRSPPSR